MVVKRAIFSALVFLSQVEEIFQKCYALLLISVIEVVVEQI